MKHFDPEYVSFQQISTFVQRNRLPPMLELDVKQFDVMKCPWGYTPYYPRPDEIVILASELGISSLLRDYLNFFDQQERSGDTSRPTGFFFGAAVYSAPARDFKPLHELMIFRLPFKFDPKFNPRHPILDVL